MAKLIETIRAKMIEATKAKREVEKTVLRLALSEIQAAENRKQGEISDDEAAKVVRKLIKSNEETLEHAKGDNEAKLREENRVLEALLPKALGEPEILAALAPVTDAIKTAKADGQATGVAMKRLKELGLAADGAIVGAVVKKLRSS